MSRYMLGGTLDTLNTYDVRNEIIAALGGESFIEATGLEFSEPTGFCVTQRDAVAIKIPGDKEIIIRKRIVGFSVSLMQIYLHPALGHRNNVALLREDPRVATADLIKVFSQLSGINCHSVKLAGTGETEVCDHLAKMSVGACCVKWDLLILKIADDSFVVGETLNVAKMPRITREEAIQKIVNYKYVSVRR